MPKNKLKDLLQVATQTDVHCWDLHTGVSSLTKTGCMPHPTYNRDKNTIGGWTTSSTHIRGYKTVNLISLKSQNGLEQTIWEHTVQL